MPSSHNFFCRLFFVGYVPWRIWNLGKHGYPHGISPRGVSCRVADRFALQGLRFVLIFIPGNGVILTIYAAALALFSIPRTNDETLLLCFSRLCNHIYNCTSWHDSLSPYSVLRSKAVGRWRQCSLLAENVSDGDFAFAQPVKYLLVCTDHYDGSASIIAEEKEDGVREVFNYFVVCIEPFYKICYFFNII